MRCRHWVAVALLWAGVAAAADSTGVHPDSIEFLYTILPVSDDGEPGVTEITWSGDTVRFTIFYVDVACQGYSYVLEHRKQLLRIKRLTSPQGSCDRSSELLYAVTGSLRRVPPGVHRFELWSQDGKKSEKLMQDLVESRKPKPAPATAAPDSAER